MNIIPWRRTESLPSSGPSIEDMWNRLWAHGNGEKLSHLPEMFRSGPLPPVNISETEGNFCITMDCPGLDEDDFQIESMGNQLVISGERKWEDEKKGKEFHRVESQYGSFERTVQLPDNVRHDPESFEATYKKGILQVVVPKREKTPSAKIPVHAE